MPCQLQISGSLRSEKPCLRGFFSTGCELNCALLKPTWLNSHFGSKIFFCFRSCRARCCQNGETIGWCLRHSAADTTANRDSKENHRWTIALPSHPRKRRVSIRAQGRRRAKPRRNLLSRPLCKHPRLGRKDGGMHRLSRNRLAAGCLRILVYQRRGRMRSLS